MQLRINIPPLTRVLLGLDIVVSFIFQVARFELGAATQADPGFLALIPQRSLFYPWVYLTATYAEQNVLTLLISCATILFGGKYLERAWGSRDLGIFVLIVTLIPNFVASLLYVAWFAITRADEQAWATIQGSVALQGAFLVAFKQLVPEHTITILKDVVKVRVKHLPAMFLAANTISGVVFGTDTALVLAWLGFSISWTYLRFYKKQQDLLSATTGGHQPRGDASETFTFASFWPDAVQIPVAAVADSAFNALVALHVCTPFSVEDIESSNEQAAARGEGSLPSLLEPSSRRGGGGKREEAERRRALALKVLDQRLHAASTNKSAEQQAAAVITPRDTDLSLSEPPRDDTQARMPEN